MSKFQATIAFVGSECAAYLAFWGGDEDLAHMFLGCGVAFMIARWWARD